MATPESSSTKKKVPENLRMLQRVIMKLKDDTISGTYLERAAKYTGLQTKVLEELKDGDEYQIESIREIDRSVVYEELTSFYLKEQIIPSTRQLFEALYKKIPPYVDIRSFRKALVKMGFVWKRRNNKNAACVVIERPTVTFERYEYLRNIIQYRNMNKRIYFVEENAVASNGDYLTLEQSQLYAKNNPEFILQRVIYAVSATSIVSVKFIESFDGDTFAEWLRTDFLPVIKGFSVIVFNSSKHHCERIIEPPNNESLKIEICKWLDYHKVSYQQEMSKYELLSLAETLTNVDANMFKLDRIIPGHAHSTLRLPDCIKKLSPGSLICNLIKINKELFVKHTEEESFSEALKGIPMNTLMNYDEYIAKHEEDIYVKDVEIDKVFDDLMEKMKKCDAGEDYDTDIPSCSDSE